MKDLRGEIELLFTPENIAAWERVMPTLSAADRAEVAGLFAEMKARGRWLREKASGSLARSA